MTPSPDVNGCMSTERVGVRKTLERRAPTKMRAARSQAELGDAHREIESRLAGHREWLQRNGGRSNR